MGDFGMNEEKLEIESEKILDFIENKKFNDLRKYLENGTNCKKIGAGGRGLVISLLRNLLDLRM